MNKQKLSRNLLTFDDLFTILDLEIFCYFSHENTFNVSGYVCHSIVMSFTNECYVVVF